MEHSDVTHSPDTFDLPESLTIRRILIPIDFSEHSKNALRYAASFAKHFGAELVLVYVVEPAIYPADFAFGQVGMPDLEIELKERGQIELDKMLQSFRGAGMKGKAIVRIGKPFLEIITVAEEERIDLILIATHGHTGMEHILFGSTAEKVVRKAKCPVLVVRSQERMGVRG